ncbi:MAG: pilus assembly protein N-terminal domain-containing protein, partial [Burkholderiales bacterium]|nr:pilus assembly protein N-terminal domain-containing protein [Burkholderiales bacterium]
MSRGRGLFLGLVLWLLTGPAFAEKDRALEIEVGSSFVVRHPSIQRLAVGNGQVVQATALSPTEAILFGKRSGTTTVTVWTSKTAHLTYRVHVKQEGHSRAMKEVAEILRRIPGARTTTVAGRVLIDGDDLTESDRSTIS